MAQEMNRRSFVAGTAALAGVGALTASATQAHADEGAYDYEADVVIVGSGMGGMSAGVQALQSGAASAIIVEISKWTGGGTSWAYGALHAGSAGKTVDTFDAFTQYMGTDELSHAVFEGFEPMLHWVQDDLQLPVDINYDLDTPFGRMLNAEGVGDPSAPRYFFDKFVEVFEGLGGQILTETRATHIITDEDHRVCGLQCADKDGNVVKIAAKSVILSCGGFQNDEELKNRYMGVEGAQIQCMGTPYNTGAGLKMAVEAGASLQGSMSQWAGCFVAAQPGKNWMCDVDAYEANDYNDEPGGKWWLYDTVIDTMDARNIWVNCDGQRFVDEGLPGISSKHAVARQRRAAAVIICDSAVWNDWMASGSCSYCDTVADQMAAITSEQVGGAYFVADTIEELADQLNASGVATYKVHKANLVKTVAEYNAAAEAGEGESLFPPKCASSYSCKPLNEPPFYAFPMQAAVYAPYGGVAIDTNAQVLDLSRKPIPGLYATVPCAGGVFHEFYTGTIAGAAITGRMAGAAAAAQVAGA